MNKRTGTGKQTTYFLAPVNDDPHSVAELTLVVVTTADDFKMYSLIADEDLEDFTLFSSAELEEDGWSYL